MARGLNKAMIIGRLGQDPDSKVLDNGDTVCNFSVATDESYKNKSGEKVEKTEWHRVSMYGKIAEISTQYLRKGAQVYIEGSLQTRKWQAQDGSDRYSTEIKAFNMKMLGGKSDDAASNQSAETQSSAAVAAQPSAPPMDDFDMDIPF